MKPNHQCLLKGHMCDQATIVILKQIQTSSNVLINTNWALRKCYGFMKIKRNVGELKRKKIICLPLHIKLELIKQFERALNKDLHCFEYLIRKFRRITMKKTKSRHI